MLEATPKTRIFVVAEKDGVQKLLTTAERPNTASFGGPYYLVASFKSAKDFEDNSLPSPCKECGGVVTLRFTPKVRKRLEESGLCHQCHFWDRLVGKAGLVVIEGQAYEIAPDNEPQFGSYGYGGAKFLISHEGKLKTTRNLWHRGEIPEWFRERFPDNAKFVSNERPVHH